MKNDFRNYAVNHLGMSSTTLDSYARAMGNGMVTTPTADYINPYILEERQLNVTHRPERQHHPGTAALSRLG